MVTGIVQECKTIATWLGNDITNMMSSEVQYCAFMCAEVQVVCLFNQGWCCVCDNMWITFTVWAYPPSASGYYGRQINAL